MSDNRDRILSEVGPLHYKKSTLSVTATPASICAWAKKTFPNATEEGRLDKFLDECAEYGLMTAIEDHLGVVRSLAITDLDDSELGDVFVTLVQRMEDVYGPWDQPGGAQCHMDALLHKLENREWHVREDGTGQHIPKDGDE